MSNFKSTKSFIEEGIKAQAFAGGASSGALSGVDQQASEVPWGEQPGSAYTKGSGVNKSYKKAIKELETSGTISAALLDLIKGGSESFIFPIAGNCYNAGYDVPSMGSRHKPGIYPARKEADKKNKPGIVHAIHGMQNNDWTAKHKGIDIFCLDGKSPLQACVTGVITKIGFLSGKGGNTVTITRGPPDNSESFYYAHMNSHASWLTKDMVGKVVKKGMILGTCGKTGSAQGTYPHLHFSYYGGSYGGDNRNPWDKYLKGAIAAAGAKRLGNKRGLNAYEHPTAADVVAANQECPYKPGLSLSVPKSAPAPEDEGEETPPGQNKTMAESHIVRVSEQELQFIIREMIKNEGIKSQASSSDSSSSNSIKKKDKNKDLNSVGGDAAARAEAEFKKWDHGKTKEGDPSMKDTLSAYWKNAKAPDYGTSQPWSAAFITYAVEPPASVVKDEKGKVKVKRNDTSFEGDAAHMKYMVAAKKARDAGAKTGYVAYKPTETEPTRGDIVCRPRGDDKTKDGYNKIGSKNHCDIYVGSGQMIGGNLGNTSKKVPYKKEKASMIIKKLAEVISRNEEVDEAIRTQAGLFGDAGSSFQRKEKQGGAVQVKDPVSLKGGSYPQENVRHVEAAMTEKGITNKFVRLGILCTIAKESNFKPKNEKTYHNTSLSRIYTIWPKLKKLGDAKVEEMKKSTSPSDGHKQPGLGFFDYLYGGRYGNGPEETGDGSRYRGRGFNQVTFKGSYKKYGRLAGIDLVGNPDQLNEPAVAAKVAVAFLANRLKAGHGSFNPDAKSAAEGIKMAAEANCKSPGAKKDCSRAISSATARLSHFSYDSVAPTPEDPRNKALTEAQKEEVDEGIKKQAQAFAQGAGRIGRSAKRKLGIDKLGDSGDLSWVNSGSGAMTKGCRQGGTSKSMGDLDPAFAKKIETLIKRMRGRGFQAKVGGTWRSAACQLEKFCMGRSAKTSPMGRHVSVTGSGKPMATAVDIIHQTGAYKPPEGEKFWDELGKQARDLGLTWGGDWTSFKDRPHVQTKTNPYASSTVAYIKSIGVPAKKGMWNKERKGIGCEKLRPTAVAKWKSKYGKHSGIAENHFIDAINDEQILAELVKQIVFNRNKN